MGTLTAIADPVARMRALLRAISEAEAGTDIEMMLGMSEDDEPSLVINVGGSFHALLVPEARRVADVLEQTLHEHPDAPGSGDAPDVIMGLRAACDKSDAAQERARNY